MPESVKSKSISIHALHEESDRLRAAIVQRLAISIHALHEESDQTEDTELEDLLFQSTLSMRRATISICLKCGKV